MAELKMSFTRTAYTLAPCSGVLCTKDRFKFPNPPQDCFGCWQPASGCGDLHEHAWGNLRATIQSVPITRLELKLGQPDQGRLAVDGCRPKPLTIALADMSFSTFAL